jgi:hypothetical protein
MDILKTRVRAVGIDRFAGLSGHAYHAARSLKRQPNRADAPDDHRQALARYLLDHDRIDTQGGSS